MKLSELKPIDRQLLPNELIISFEVTDDLNSHYLNKQLSELPIEGKITSLLKIINLQHKTVYQFSVA